jgi:hypothetical protein
VKTFYLRVVDTEDGSMHMGTEWSMNDDVIPDNPEFRSLIERYVFMFSGIGHKVTVQLFDLSTPTHVFLVED